MYDKFEKLLAEKKLTPYQVSKATGVATSTLTEWKKGSYTPKLDKIAKIANFLGVSIEYFVGGTEKAVTRNGLQ